MRLALIYFFLLVRGDFSGNTFPEMYNSRSPEEFFFPFLSLCVSVVLLLHGHVDLVLPLSHTSNVN